MSGQPDRSPRQKLDVETQDDRQARLGALLSSISATPASPHLTPESTSPFPINASKPFAMPESTARARAFLPMMQSSNEELIAKMRDDPNDVNIENTEGDERVIAMDVNLGVFDVNGQPSGSLGPEITLPEASRDTTDDDSGDEHDEDSGMAMEESDSSDDGSISEEDNEAEQRA